MTDHGRVGIIPARSDRSGRRERWRVQDDSTMLRLPQQPERRAHCPHPWHQRLCEAYHFFSEWNLEVLDRQQGTTAISAAVFADAVGQGEGIAASTLAVPDRTQGVVCTPLEFTRLVCFSLWYCHVCCSIVSVSRLRIDNRVRQPDSRVESLTLGRGPAGSSLKR